MTNFEYKGYYITAEVRSFDRWTINEDGNLAEHVEPILNSIEDDDITYVVEDKEDGFLESFDNFEDAKSHIDTLAK